jgi:hypothetical protein
VRLTSLIYGNQVRQSYGNGIRITNGNSAPDSAMVQVDSNLVTGSTADGIRLDGGADSLVHNRIVSNQLNGVEIASTSVDQIRTQVDSNNIAGNGFGVAGPVEYTYNAQYDWWGDAKGPRCSSGCDPASLGDSVFMGLVFAPIDSTAEYGNTPAPAVLARPILALRGPAVRAVKAPAPRGLDAPVAHKTQAALSAPAMVARAPQPSTPVAAVPPRLSGARAQAWQRRAQQRTAGLAMAAQRHAAVTATLAQVAAGQAALDQREQERKAQHETRLKAKLAREAAARAARTHVVRQ